MQVVAVLANLPSPACTSGVTNTTCCLGQTGMANNDRLCDNSFMMWTNNVLGTEAIPSSPVTCDQVGTLTLVSRDKKTKCQYNKRVRWGKNFGYFSFVFSKLSEEKNLIVS